MSVAESITEFVNVVTTYLPDDGLDFLKAVATVGAVMFYAECYVPPEDTVVCYHWQAQFETMPNRDDDLQDWVDFAPGTDPLSTDIARGGSLNIYFGIRQNLLGKPEFPDFATQCARLGYTGIRNASLTRSERRPGVDNPYYHESRMEY